MSKAIQCMDNVHTKSSKKPNFAIRATHLHKSFRLPTERAAGLKQAIFNWLKGVKGYTEQKVLDDVSFEIKPGEFVGIVGEMAQASQLCSRFLLEFTIPNKGISRLMVR